MASPSLSSAPSLPGTPSLVTKGIFTSALPRLRSISSSLLPTSLAAAASNTVWPHFVSFSRQQVLQVFSHIELGSLLIDDHTTHQQHHFGTKPPKSKPSHPPSVADPPLVHLIVHRPAFWPRLLLAADMGFAEALMLGDVSVPDQTAFVRLFILNRSQLGDAATPLSSLWKWGAGKVRSVNSVPQALVNIQKHYDLSNDMFAAFLSPDMTYSCPIWGAEPESLEAAQMRKLRRFVANARIKSTDHVLEIGTGWGSFAMEAVRATGCRVTSLTLSREQQVLAEARIREAGMEGRIEVLLRDYRELEGSGGVPEGGFDKIVSIEMLEAVGREFLATYFGFVERVLKREGGVAVFQCITMPEGRHGAYSENGTDFINEYIFPGGYLPSITQLLNHISKESNGTLIIESVENIGGHYAKALRLWREAFVANFEEKIKPSLLERGSTVEETEIFLQKWKYYFSYCEAAFVTKTLGDVIITVGREGSIELMEGIPI
ncbi:Tuberculostearic acid methyltransferase UfaA1 [Podospora conica]|nr:Tuberculostearic acid methyltransferase UfaA1 [Schizothecium conicum]